MIGHTALHWAASKNQQQLAIWLLKEGLPVSVKNNADSTPLHTAALNGHLQVAQTLLDAGADPLAMDSDGTTPIGLAKERGHSGVAKVLEVAAGKFLMIASLRELSTLDEASWKIGEMKKALKFAPGVDVESISEKMELISLTRDLIAKSADAIAAAPPEPPPPDVTDKVPAAATKAAAPAPPEDVDSEDDDGEAVAAGAERAKAAGNAAFGKGDFQLAVKQFGIAIRLSPKNHVLYSNRSGAYASLGNGGDALTDANKCVEISPQWAKGHGRKGAALILLGRYKEAMKAYKAGIEIDPTNVALQKGMEDLRASLREGEVPTVPSESAAKPAAQPKAAAEAPSTSTKPAKPAGAGGGAGGGGGSSVSSSLPIGQQWIEHSKRGEQAEMEALLATDSTLVTYKARGIGHTAMHWAASTGDRKMMDWLLGLGAEVNGRNSSEATPLHTAAGAGQAMSLEWLLAHGADGTLQNDDGESAAAVAKKKQRPDLAATIERAMAAPPAPAAAPPRAPHEEEVD